MVNNIWLVVSTSLENVGLRQLGWLFMEKSSSHVPVTSNQITIIFPWLLVYSLWKPLLTITESSHVPTNIWMIFSIAPGLVFPTLCWSRFICCLAAKTIQLYPTTKTFQNGVGTIFVLPAIVLTRFSHRKSSSCWRSYPIPIPLESSHGCHGRHQDTSRSEGVCQCRAAEGKGCHDHNPNLEWLAPAGRWSLKKQKVLYPQKANYFDLKQPTTIHFGRETIFWLKKDNDDETQNDKLHLFTAISYHLQYRRFCPFLSNEPHLPKIFPFFPGTKKLWTTSKNLKKRKKKTSPPHHNVFPVLGHIPTEASYACDLRNGLHPCPGRSAWARPRLGRKLGVSTHCHFVCPIFHTYIPHTHQILPYPILYTSYIQIPAKTVVWIEAARRQWGSQRNACQSDIPRSCCKDESWRP